MRLTRLAQVLCTAIGAALFWMAASAGDGPSVVPKDQRIGFVLTDLYWAIYQSPDGKSECPHGYNDGPREQYAKLFPKNGRTYNVVDTQLKQEAQTWLPTATPDGFVFYEAGGKLAYGLNLDGKVGPNDFSSPDGETGIDNQLYRALGCIIGFRGPDGVEYIFENKAIAQSRYNRLMFELTGVDSLTNDPDVTVTIYRGLDRLLTDATGNKVMPGGSQRIDTRWGAKLVRQAKGKIVNGVLTTEPLDDLVIPWMNLGVPTFQIVRDMRLKFNLTATSAQGLIGGYVDVDTWYTQLIRNDSTHHLSNGQISGISLYKALRRLADAYPDQKTGENTAISAALNAKLVQVYIHALPEAEKTRLVEGAKHKPAPARQAGLASPLPVRR